ncbi:hypothetical protein Daus18300_011207 [Diaporthe australafricana]|uniref:Cupin type-2 domain-containing protein n=1 Tax=Diaporthe australafricana TaxID=127596 RepID=A0ABR3W7Y1_9PEZI
MDGTSQRPLQYEDTDNGPVARALEGAITTRSLPAQDIPPGRDHMFEIVFQLDHPRFIQLRGQKPPLHFHSSQEEYMTVLEGRLCIEVEGQERVLTSDDGEVAIRPWTHHRLWPPPPADGPSGRRTVFLLSSTDSDQTFKLDEVFYENWYSYQEEIVIRGKKVDVLQVLSR